MAFCSAPSNAFRQIIALRLLGCALLTVTSAPYLAHAEGPPATASSTAAPIKPPPAKKTPKGLIEERSTDDAGIFYGHVGLIDSEESTLVIYPINRKAKPRTFVLDKFSKIKSGKKALPRKKLARGQKVAVRYFAVRDIALIEAIFVVHGEFNPKEYLPPQPSGAASGGGEGGGGGGH